MRSVKLLLSEIRFRKLNFLLSLAAMSAAVALFVAGPTLVDGYGRDTRDQLGVMQSDAADQLAAQQAETDKELASLEDDTRKLMLTMGFNLLIVHRDTNMADFWASDYAAHDMPQEYVKRLASSPQLTLVTHLVATLQEKIRWLDRNVLLVGYLPETPQAHIAAKKPMGYQVEPGTVYLGYELGLGRKEGDKVDVLGREFTIAKILPERGSKEDISIVMDLADAQQALGKPGRVNQILAIGCRCAGERLPKIRQQLADALPETKITEFQSIAVARAEQRDLVAAERQAIVEEERQRHSEVIADFESSRGRTESTLRRMTTVVGPLVVLACAVWVGLLALGNVRERRPEIGLLRALGKSSAYIASLLLGKAVLLGLAAGLLGFVLGLLAARALGTGAFGVSGDYFSPSWALLAWALLGAPLVAAMASYLPILLAVTEDPAVVLRDQ